MALKWESVAAVRLMAWLPKVAVGRGSRDVPVSCERSIWRPDGGRLRNVRHRRPPGRKVAGDVRGER